jgi:hypothetical protein
MLTLNICYAMSQSEIFGVLEKSGHGFAWIDTDLFLAHEANVCPVRGGRRQRLFYAMRKDWGWKRNAWSLFHRPASARGGQFPQGLKPTSLIGSGGTAEAVPFPKPTQNHLWLATAAAKTGFAIPSHRTVMSVIAGVAESG